MGVASRSKKQPGNVEGKMGDVVTEENLGFIRFDYSAYDRWGLTYIMRIR